MSVPDSTLPPALPSTVETELRTRLEGRLAESDLDTVIDTVHAVILRIEQTCHLSASSDALHADETEKLDRLVPGFAREYASVFLRGINHQIEWEKEDQSILREAQKRGMDYGFIIGIALVVGAVICGVTGAREVGMALAGASAVGMVGKFIDGWRRKGDS
jgi:hypothetical protein